MECQICKQNFNSIRSLSTHIQFKHDNDKRGYYDLFLRNPKDGECKICKGPTDFYLLQYGYKKYCSKECEKKDKENHMNKNNPMKNDLSKQNQRNTNLERYGVSQNTKRPEIKSQIKKTNLMKYGVENVIKNKEIQERSKKSRGKTCFKNHGVNSYFQVPSVQQKLRETFVRKYGVLNPLKNPEIFLKAQKTAKTIHKFDESLYYRGSFELDFLKIYSDKFKIHQGKSFRYEINNHKRTYHSDFYIPSMNLIIEIKNSYLANRFKESIEEKKKSVINEGYSYIMIVDKKYDEFNLFIESYPFS